MLDFSEGTIRVSVIVSRGSTKPLSVQKCCGSIRSQCDTRDRGPRLEEMCSDKEPYLFDVMWPSGTSSVGVVSSIFQLQGSIMSGYI